MAISAAGPQRRGLGINRYVGLLFALPALILMAIFVIYPVGWTIALSFNDGRGLNFGEWVGLDNYVQLLTRDRLFLDLSEFPPSGAVMNNVLWLLLYPVLCIGLGLVFATVATRVRYEGAFKALIFVPQAIAAAAVAIIWRFVFFPDPGTGVLNAALTAATPIDPIAWLGNRDTVNYALITAQVWASTGFALVILSAAIKGIPAEILEASRVDGATEWQAFRRIIVPMVSLPIAVIAVTLVINVVKLFDLIYIMTRGGPSNASRVIGYSMFRETFEARNGGYGAAIAVLMLLLVIPFIFFNIRRFRSEAVQS